VFATNRDLPNVRSADVGPCGFTDRTQFDVFFATWFARIHRFAATRLCDRAAAEAVTRAVLERAIRERLVGAGERLAPRLLALLCSEIQRSQGAHDFVTRTPRTTP
jgi:hypothetical protein